MKKQNKIKMPLRIFAAVMAILMASMMLMPLTARAEENSEYGNAWVYDEAKVVSDETEAYIAELNEVTFANYKNKPQLAFIILQKLPDHTSIDTYKLDMFNEYGVGTKEENQGMLFVFAIDDREYALEIGDGFQKGTLLRKDLETDFITDDMKTSLRNEDYDAVVNQVAQHLAGIMLNVENGTYAEKQAAHDAKQAEIKANFEKIIRIVGLVFIAAILFIGLCIGMYYLIRYLLRRHTIKQLIKQYDKHFDLFGSDKQRVATKIYKYLIDSNVEYIKHVFTSKLHDYYLESQNQIILSKCQSFTDERNHWYSDYVRQFALRNELENFEKMQLVSIETTMAEVDEREAKRQAVREQNDTIVTQFLEKNENRIVNKNIRQALIERFDTFRHCCDELVDEETLEKCFVKDYEELDFEYEVEQFCKENADRIETKDFNKQAFIKELRQTDNYHSHSRTNNMWMLHFLMLHMAMNRNNRIQREAEEKCAAERRAAQLRDEDYSSSYSSYNSTFGSGFGGGFSSGGGFKGGW